VQGQKRGTSLKTPGREANGGEIKQKTVEIGEFVELEEGTFVERASTTKNGGRQEELRKKFSKGVCMSGPSLGGTLQH